MKEEQVQIMCRDCGTLLGDVVCGTHVRWENEESFPHGCESPDSYPIAAEHDPRPDPLASARGIVLGLGISIIFWILLTVLILALR